MRIADQSSTLLTRRRHLTLWFGLSLCAIVCASASAQQPARETAAPLPQPTLSQPHRTRTARFLQGRRSVGAAPIAQSLAASRAAHQAMAALPRNTNLSANWTPVGPGQVLTAAFGSVTGRVTSIAVDPADPTGNTVYVGTTGGGVWKSQNAAGPASAVSFVPLTDNLPVFSPGTATTASLSIGAVAVANGIVLAGTGDPNDATDSYYGSGILRSADGGTTWTLAQQSIDGATGNHSFFGLSIAGFAFSSANPALVVAAVSQAVEGDLVNAASTTHTTKGLYYSSDAGITWHLATIADGSQVIQGPSSLGTVDNAATSVVWNPVRQRFYAAVRFHGYYESSDGVTWTRLAHQPGAGLTLAACPTNAGLAASSACPMFRGALAVQPATGDTFALTVSAANVDQGLYRDVCALSGTACASPTITFSTALNAAPLESGSSHVIPQGDYNLALAAAPLGSDTVLFAGTIDLYRCTLASGCSLRNTTNAQNGCASNALVAPAQHALATVSLTGGPLLYLGNDGGLWRSSDGVNQTAAPCSLDDANHFQNLNPGLGSLAEVVSFAQSPADGNTLLAGLGALGTAGTSTVTNPWPQLSTGEGGTVAIDAQNPSAWYLSTGAGISIGRCDKGASCTAKDFSTSVIGAAQTSSEAAEVHAPWLLDPGLTANLILGTCRVWRGPATGGALWSTSNRISAPLGAPAATNCSASFPLLRTLAAGGPVSTSSIAQNSGSRVLYAGIAGSADGGAGLGGHVFVTTSADTATGTTAWLDVAKSPVTNDAADAGIFNPGHFDISSLAVDPHDATGQTVYATAMGFTGNAINAPHLYRSVDAGAHWTNISSNLPNAPANSVVVDPNDANTLYIALDTGVYVTTQVSTCTTTNCWSVFGTSLPDAPVMALSAAPALPTGDGRTGELRAGTYGRGIWQIPLLTAAPPAAPAIQLSPSTVTYSAQQAGTVSAPVTITVTNTGTAPLIISSLAISGDFFETDNCASVTIAPTASCQVNVTFAPSVAGNRDGLLTIYGNVTGGQATAALSGTGTAPAAVVLTPTSLNFASTPMGSTSSVQNITISNTGGVAVALQTPLINGDFHLAANTCGNNLGPQTGCTVSIAFTPTTSGVRSGTLTVVDDAGTQIASLTGTGTAAATDTLAPLNLSFPATQLNQASPVQSVTLTNSGDVALTLITAQITAGDFTVFNSCGNSLNAHSACTLNIAFAPKSVGSQAGVLTISDQFRSQTVLLNGIGLAPPGVSLSPVNGIAFGAVGVGLSSAVQTVTLTNNGGVPLAITSIAASGDFVIAPGLNTCGATLAPSAVCTVGIIFAPVAAGSRTGSLTFADNASSSPQTILFSGTGVDYTLTPSGSISMTVPSGQTASYALLLDSAAGLPGSVTFACSGAPAHTTCTVNPSAAALGGTTPVNVTIATGQLHALLTPAAHPWAQPLICFALLLPAAFVAKRRRMPALCATLLLCTLCGCSVPRLVPGDGTSAGGVAITPAGSYPIVVTATGAGLTRSVSLTLIVQ